MRGRFSLLIECKRTRLPPHRDTTDTHPSIGEGRTPAPARLASVCLNHVNCLITLMTVLSGQHSTGGRCRGLVFHLQINQSYRELFTGLVLTLALLACRRDARNASPHKQWSIHLHDMQGLVLLQECDVSPPSGSSSLSGTHSGGHGTYLISGRKVSPL